MKMERETKRSQDLRRGDKIILGTPGSVYTVGNTQHYGHGDVKVNLTDVEGWTYNRHISGKIKMAN
jgi:predicted transport protein